jgi:hypothetical protein
MTACCGALAALVLAAVVGHFLTPIRHPEVTAPNITARGKASLVAVGDVFTAEEQSALARSFDAASGGPAGKLLRGRHGVTHFALDGDQLDRLVVLASGLGTNMHIYDEFVGPLLAADCAVLRCVVFCVVVVVGAAAARFLLQWIDRAGFICSRQNHSTDASSRRAWGVVLRPTRTSLRPSSACVQCIWVQSCSLVSTRASSLFVCPCRYDYFGHGWSVSEDKIPTYDKKVHVAAWVGGNQATAALANENNTAVAATIKATHIKPSRPPPRTHPQNQPPNNRPARPSPRPPDTHNTNTTSVR